MMIFQRTWQKVLSKEKTQTRRVVKEGEIDDITLACDALEWPDLRGRVKVPGNINAVMHYCINGDLKLKWAIDHTYAVQPAHTQKAVARIKVTGLRREWVENISEEDAKAEGFANRFDFWQTWRAMHGHTAMNCWVIEFELVQ